MSGKAEIRPAPADGEARRYDDIWPRLVDRLTGLVFAVMSHEARMWV